MPRYKIDGFSTTTNRERSRVYFAGNIAEARKQAESNSIVIHEIVELEPTPPSDQQLFNASHIGLRVPDGINSDELHDLINFTKWRDTKARPGLAEIATSYGVPVTQYTGKKHLFLLIFKKLTQPGREIDLAAWFAYRVYRGLVHGFEKSTVENPGHPTIQAAAKILAADKNVIEAIRRYRASDLIRFGKWKGEDGNIHQGGNTRTIAYTKTADIFRQAADEENQVREVLLKRRELENPAMGESASEEIEMDLTDLPEHPQRLGSLINAVLNDPKYLIASAGLLFVFGFLIVVAIVKR